VLFAIPLSLLRRFSCAMETRHTPSERHRPTVLVAMHPERMAALVRFPTRDGHTATAGRIQATVKATRWEAVCARWRLSTTNTESRTILSIQWPRNGSRSPANCHPCRMDPNGPPLSPYARRPPARVSQRARAHPRPVSWRWRSRPRGSAPQKRAPRDRWAPSAWISGLISAGHHRAVFPNGRPLEATQRVTPTPLLATGQPSPLS